MKMIFEQIFKTNRTRKVEKNVGKKKTNVTYIIENL